ncbi:DUF4190 domain-containing protein [Kineococcus sp. NPDC059986]|uniref:DUF4190 domain-containing protein n=1 Tax=Kineococcus sp. NPDC059986 TaxID=3155538 RepID=UPI00344CBAB4
MTWHHPSSPPGPGAFPPPYPPTRPTSTSALAVVGLCTGIASIALVAVLGPFAAALGVAGVVTGAIALGRRLPGRGMALAGLVTGAVGTLLSVVLTVVLVVFTGGVFLTALLGSSGAWSAPDPGGPDDGQSAGELAFGAPAELDEYTVTVDGVTTRGDVVFADLTVQFTGQGSGDSYEDLYGYLYDADGYSYDATDCTEPLSPDAADLPDLAPGQTASFQMCFEGVPDAAGAWVEVDDAAAGTYAGWTDPGTLQGPDGGGGGVV